MRELTVRIRFTSPCLGNVPDRTDPTGKLLFLRTPQQQVMFLATWHQQNMRLAAKLLNRYQSDVEKIFWDVAVDGVLRQGTDRWFRRYYTTASGRRRFAMHESFFPNQIIGFNCVVPTTISDDTMIQLLDMAGRYKGLSPWKPGEFGHYVTEGIYARRTAAPSVPVITNPVPVAQDSETLSVLGK